MTEVQNLGDVVSRQGDPATPIIIGVGFDGSETVLSRAELDAMADAVARGLLKRGLTRGDRVAILSANRPEYVAVTLGAMRAGIVPAPVNFKFPRPTIAQVIADSGAKVVFCDAERRAQSPDGVETVEFDGPDFAAWLDPGAFEPIVPRADEPALTLYTSGSTGRPKGVLLSHASHIWVARTRMADDDLSGQRMLVAAPLYHMNALANVLLACGSGATVVLLPQFKATAFIEAIGRHRVTWATAVPPMIAMMLREKEALARADLSSVRVVRMGSAPVNDTLAARIRDLLPNARIINVYGTTEGGPVVFSDKGGAPTGSVGKAHPQVEARLVGDGAPETGVLQMKSPAIMLGYHNRPDVLSPITEDGFYDTGDVFRRDADGFFYFLGRVDDMFVSGGENIYPGEVEAVLETHPDVLQASVVPVDDEIKGQKPVAFIVRKPGSTVDEQAIKAFALEHAPAYQHPRRVWFLDQMLLASTNKIDRAALRARAEAELKSR
ncbi:class I adenylate-forming enzyme family protein [Hansschlegelia zhihuaiae]|uniref:Long-chain fatty acid--CoA ligase n=1 Tax=Hansschlegelia zhihuaiae TaxID=405005 RepID=A0A4Q0M6U8_9HYPH|nr:class I adenylate-forming enzyme family protein [Hansschlegelia zhihuaiae]RXF68489.1 long-chain fatty acid--CoA ligase [Hansschlegelia zhihuaiae]